MANPVPFQTQITVPLDPTAPLQVATKQYVDGNLPLDGGNYGDTYNGTTFDIDGGLYSTGNAIGLGSNASGSGTSSTHTAVTGSVTTQPTGSDFFVVVAWFGPNTAP